MRGKYKFYHWSITVYTGLSLVSFIVCRHFLGATLRCLMNIFIDIVALFFGHDYPTFNYLLRFCPYMVHVLYINVVGRKVI